VRAAAMMRRCLNEAMCVARSRVAFGSTLIEMPLMRRQLLKLMVPAEQALSMYAWTADVMGRANRGDESAAHLLRILTPLYKFRACRDNLRAATGAMEVRGGNGYIEEWVNARLVRDAQIGVLWEGTSNINALDAIGRAAARMHSHEALGAALRRLLDEAREVPLKFRARLAQLVDRAVAFAGEVSGKETEQLTRLAAGALYNVATAVLMAWEAARLNEGRRLLLSRMVVEHRLSPQDPLALRSEGWEDKAAALLLADDAVALAEGAATVQT
jgi:acyl-CoA dehydrogenase